MPMPRMPFKTGNSGSVIGTPSNSEDSSAMAARTRMEQWQTGQPAPSRERPSDGRSHSVPQMLQRNFPESENVKRSPPVTIVNDLDRHFLVAGIRGSVFEHRALLRKIRIFRGMRDKGRARIGDNRAQDVGVAEIDGAHRRRTVAEQINRFENPPIDDIDIGRP